MEPILVQYVMLHHSHLTYLFHSYDVFKITVKTLITFDVRLTISDRQRKKKKMTKEEKEKREIDR